MWLFSGCFKRARRPCSFGAAGSMEAEGEGSEGVRPGDDPIRRAQPGLVVEVLAELCLCPNGLRGPRRLSGVSAVLQAYPVVGWNLLLGLLPSSVCPLVALTASMESVSIPAGWSGQVRTEEYWQEIDLYADLAIQECKKSNTRLAQLVEYLPKLPPSAATQLLEHLGSHEITGGLPEHDRSILWEGLTDLTVKHRKYPEADWNMGKQLLAQCAALIDRLAPKSGEYAFRRLFGEQEHELYEDAGDWEAQGEIIANRRRDAIRSILAESGPNAVAAFARTV